MKRQYFRRPLLYSKLEIYATKSKPMSNERLLWVR